MINGLTDRPCTKLRRAEHGAVAPDLQRQLLHQPGQQYAVPFAVDVRPDKSITDRAFDCEITELRSQAFGLLVVGFEFDNSLIPTPT